MTLLIHFTFFNLFSDIYSLHVQYVNVSTRLTLIKIQFTELHVKV